MTRGHVISTPYIVSGIRDIEQIDNLGAMNSLVNIFDQNRNIYRHPIIYFHVPKLAFSLSRPAATCSGRLIAIIAPCEKVVTCKYPASLLYFFGITFSVFVL